MVRIDRDSYKQRAGKISVQLEEIKRKIEDAENSKKLLEQNELSDKIKTKKISWEFRASIQRSCVRLSR